MPTRHEVYEAIDGERLYQDSLWNDLDTRNTTADFLLYMKQQLDKALWQHNADRPESDLNLIRKVTAIGVAAMERHGAPKREGF